MLLKLRKKLFNCVFWVLLAFVVITSVVSFATISGFLFNTQTQRCQSNVQSGATGCQSYVQAAMDLTANAATNSEIVEFLKGGTLDVSQKLNEFYNYSVTTDGVILYSVGGHVSCSSGVGSAPTLAQLLAVEEIGSFMQSSQTQMISVRTEAVAKVYGSTQYNEKNGVVSCLCKVMDGDQVLGLLEVDVLPKSIVQAKLSYSGFSSASYVFFQKNGKLFTDNDEFSAVQQDGTFNRIYYAACAQTVGDCQLIMFSPLSNYFKQVLVLGCVFFALDAVLCCAVSLVAFRVRDSVVDPLENLLQRMNEEGIS